MNMIVICIIYLASWFDTFNNAQICDNPGQEQAANQWSTDSRPTKLNACRYPQSFLIKVVRRRVVHTTVGEFVHLTFQTLGYCTARADLCPVCVVLGNNIVSSKLCAFGFFPRKAFGAWDEHVIHAPCNDHHVVKAEHEGHHYARDSNARQCWVNISPTTYCTFSHSLSYGVFDEEERKTLYYHEYYVWNEKRTCNQKRLFDF